MADAFCLHKVTSNVGNAHRRVEPSHGLSDFRPICVCIPPQLPYVLLVCLLA